MADDKLPDSADESDETRPTEPTEASDTPAELTADAEIDDARDTPDGYVDDPSTPDINEAKLDRATDEVAEDHDAVPVDPVERDARPSSERRRERASRPVRRAKGATAAEAVEPATETAEVDETEPVRIGAGRTRSTAPVRRDRPADSGGASKRMTPAKFVMESVGELRKVVWPTGNEVQQYFVIVLVFVLFIMTVVSLLDLGFGWLILKMFG